MRHITLDQTQLKQLSHILYNWLRSNYWAFQASRLVCQNFIYQAKQK